MGFPLVLWAAGPVNAAQWLPDADFEVSLEYREFLQQPWLDDQPERGMSVYGLGDMAWDTGDSSRLTFKPFYRYDSEDSERTHGDIRELQFQWWGSRCCMASGCMMPVRWKPLCCRISGSARSAVRI